MEKQMIGKFFAESFNGKVYEFIIYNDNTMSCPEMTDNRIYRILLKPRFELLCENNVWKSLPDTKNSKDMIKNYYIHDEIFAYLKEKDMIRYSTDMAYLYDFCDKDGYDKKYREPHPYKWAEKKGKVLVKQKQGEFK